MDLFAVVPDRLFSVLASPARAVYAHILFLIYDLHRQELYGTPREAVIDAAAAYLETEAIPDEEFETEGTTATPRDKASAVLRRLQETGWLDVERRTDYEQYINLADYAIAILDTLDKVRHQERAEYAAFVFATYVSLTNDQAGQNPGLAIGKAYDQTHDLVRELQSLLQNIKRYTEQLLRQKEPKEILAMHFGDYKQAILDRAYHRLKTTDNVSRFRPAILERIDTWLAEPGWLAVTAADEVRRGRHPSAEAAESVLTEQLAFIRHHYEQMDDLLDEIDRRNASYAKASLEQIRYLLSGGRDTEGQLAALLQFLASQMEAGLLAPDSPWPAEWDSLLRIGAVQTLEPSSLFTPRSARKNHTPQPLAATIVDPTEREAARLKARRRLSARLTYERVDQYVGSQLGDRAEIRAVDLSIQSPADFIRLIYVSAYGNSRRVRYHVEFQGQRVESADGRFSFKNIRIRRKQGAPWSGSSSTSS